jgi:hypothetical protein
MGGLDLKIADLSGHVIIQHYNTLKQNSQSHAIATSGHVIAVPRKYAFPQSLVVPFFLIDFHHSPRRLESATTR